MVFIAETDDGDLIAAAEAENGDYRCIDCGEVVRTRKSHTRGDGVFVSRHFYHPNGTGTGGGGCGGESERHLEMKSIAKSKANHRWGGAVEEATIGDRRADVLVEFNDCDQRLGYGVAIECQHKNEDKDTESVTDDFIQNGYSVLWLWEEQYTGKDVCFDDGEWHYAWAGQVPPEEYWPGYHGVIKWLRSDKPSSAKIDVRIPVSVGELPLDRKELMHRFEKGYCAEQLDEETPIHLSCPNCTEIVEAEARVDTKFEVTDRAEWRSSLYIPDGDSTECDSCGHTIYPLKLPSLTAYLNRRNVEPSRKASHLGHIGLPCPRCQQQLVMRTTYSVDRPESVITLRASSIVDAQCLDCHLIVEAQSNPAWMSVNQENYTENPYTDSRYCIRKDTIHRKPPNEPETCCGIILNSESRKNKSLKQDSYNNLCSQCATDTSSP